MYRDLHLVFGFQSKKVWFLYLQGPSVKKKKIRNVFSFLVSTSTIVAPLKEIPFNTFFPFEVCLVF